MYIEQFEKYIKLEKQMSSHTVKAYMSDLSSFKSFCKTNFQTKNLSYLPYSVIRNWTVSLVNQSVSNRSINRKLSSLKAYYRFLLKTGVITKTPFVKHKALKTSKEIQLPFSVNEMVDCFEKNEFSDDFQGLRDRLIIELFYATGIRRSELINLKEKYVNLHNKSLKVLGKRNKERIIPLTSHCVTIIKEYLRFREDYISQITEDFFFITDKGKRLNETLVYRIVNKNLKAISSKSKTSPHILRHTMATHMLNNGADLNSVKELLGHSSLTATQIYTHSSIEEMKKQYQKAHPRTGK